MVLSQAQLEMLVCPVCHGRLTLVSQVATIACLACGRRYPIVDDLPVLIAARAVQA